MGSNDSDTMYLAGRRELTYICRGPADMLEVVPAAEVLWVLLHYEHIFLSGMMIAFAPAFGDHA